MQALRIGVVLSQTGAAHYQGQAQANAVGVLAETLRREGSLIELIIRDDASDPLRTVEAVERLIEQGVHALVCCTQEAATRGISRFVEAAQVLTLAPSPLPTEAGSWLFSVVPDERRLLQSAVLHQAAKGQRRFALMTLDNSFGSETAAALVSLMSPAANTQLVAQQRYAPNATVLTPEALWVATRLPETVFAWGLPRDTELAVGALALRGYSGDVMLNPRLLDAPSGVDPSALSGALLPVSPAAVAADLPQTHVTAEATGDYFRAMAQVYGTGRIPANAAPVYDAVNLLRAAYDQAYTYGVPLENLPSFRGVLRDAFIGMGPVTGASAVFDYSERDAIGIVPTSLVMARLVDGQLRYEP